MRPSNFSAVNAINARLAGEFKASYAFLERNINLVRRYAGWELCFLVYAMVSTFSIGLIGKTMGDDRAVLYLLVGALMWSFLSSIFNEVAHSISWERWEDTLEYTFMAPVHRLTHLVGVTWFAIVYGLARTLIVLLACSWFFELNLAGANIPGAMLILAASCFPMLGMGLVVAVMPLLSAEKGTQAAHIILGIVLLISGVYYPIEALPAWLQPLGRICPVTYSLDGVRKALLDGTSTLELLPLAGALLLAGIVLIPAGYAVFTKGEHFAKVHGLLKRSG
ncbi:MAG TPA: ABC transporter permease [Firmicutes bacterium]|nr:ABC transporter permease [Bacillota bacterium]